MLDPNITELAGRRIQNAFRDRAKQLHSDILKSKSDAGGRVSGNALVQLVSENCADDIELRAGIVWDVLKDLISKTGVEWSNTLSSDLRNEVLKYQEAIVLDASASLNLAARQANRPLKYHIAGALAHALDKVYADIDLFLLERQVLVPQKKTDVQQLSGHYVDPTRIKELTAVEVGRFDLSRLTRICEELNVCYNFECYFAVTMLVRSVLDHVPPIFSCKTFSEIANNYVGSKSFRESMLHLENSSRNIADHHLHGQIRKSETLPNKTQVNFANDIDVLLAEIVRVLK